MALQLVRACHAGATGEMLRQIRSNYTTWHYTHNDGHLGTYWNVRIQKFVWLNGFHGPHLDVLVPSIAGSDDNTIIGFSHTMARQRQRLETLRRHAVYIP
jgi:hypothetical protein